MAHSQPTTIDHLQRVTLRIEAGRTPEKMDLTPGPAVEGFIFGIGGQGLSPFEYVLAGRSVGDEVNFTVRKGEAGKLFEHLVHILPRFSETEDLFFLKVGVADIGPADSQEIIRAMANMASCGDDCGDGCCGHRH
jgi:hypothetical protein